MFFFLYLSYHTVVHTLRLLQKKAFHEHFLYFLFSIHFNVWFDGFTHLIHIEHRLYGFKINPLLQNSDNNPHRKKFLFIYMRSKVIHGPHGKWIYLLKRRRWWWWWCGVEWYKVWEMILECIWERVGGWGEEKFHLFLMI